MSHSASLFLCAPLLLAGMSVAVLAGEQAPQASPAASHGRVHVKYGAPVDLRFSVPDHLAANKPFEVTLEITPGIDATLLSLDWSIGSGLSLSGSAAPVQLAAVTRGTTYRRTVTLVAAADGEYRIGAVVRLSAGTAPLNRAVAQRLQVGVPLARPKPALTRDARQELIEASPAQETVSRR